MHPFPILPTEHKSENENQLSILGPGIAGFYPDFEGCIGSYGVGSGHHHHHKLSYTTLYDPHLGKNPALPKPSIFGF